MEASSSATASQGSVDSEQSGNSSRAAVSARPASGTVSQWTSDTDPASSASSDEQTRPQTPGAVMAPPPPSTAPNGTKRTASGHVKNAASLPSTPYVVHSPSHASGRPRGDSISSTGSRAGELAASLKTRLGYAMAKVHHGWEHKDIRELERLAAMHHRASDPPPLHPLPPPITATTSDLGRWSVAYDLDHLTSTTTTASFPRPSKRHSAMASISHPLPRLQPAPDIRPTPHHPLASPTHHRATATTTTTMSPPHTPLARTTHRTDRQTAEAERDALQALFQLGSPQSRSTQHPHPHFPPDTSLMHVSPRRIAPSRRVTFARGEDERHGCDDGDDGGMART